MESKPLISVIIPTYNDAPYISRAIESVLQQDFQDFEIIIIDDGSTDNTKEVLYPYLKNSKIRYFYQKNQGVSAARNRGILEANGKFVTFLDADDFILSGTLKKKVDMLFLNNSLFGFTDYYLLKSVDDYNNLENLIPSLRSSDLFSIIDPYRSVFHSSVYIVPRSVFCNWYIKNTYLLLQSIIVEKDFLIKQNIWFDERLSISEDHDFIWKIVVAKDIKNIIVLDEPTYVYQFYYASWKKNYNYYQKILYYKNLAKLLRKRNIFSRRFLSEVFYRDYWAIFSSSPYKYRFMFLCFILSLYPLKIKYWKSLLGVMFKGFLEKNLKYLCSKIS